jgi:AmiR/NasT family two-component response regulator
MKGVINSIFAVLELSPNRHVYIMSALSSRNVQNEVKEQGARGFFGKPVNLADLKGIIDSMYHNFGLQA